MTGALRELFRSTNFYGAHPWGLAGIRCRATPSGLAIVCGEAYLASSAPADAIAGAWLVRANRGQKMKRIVLIAGARPSGFL